MNEKEKKFDVLQLRDIFDQFVYLNGCECSTIGEFFYFKKEGKSSTSYLCPYDNSELQTTYSNVSANNGFMAFNGKDSWLIIVSHKRSIREVKGAEECGQGFLVDKLFFFRDRAIFSVPGETSEDLRHYAIYRESGEICELDKFLGEKIVDKKFSFLVFEDKRRTFTVYNPILDKYRNLIREVELRETTVKVEWRNTNVREVLDQALEKLEDYEN